MTLDTVDDYDPEQIPSVGEHAVVLGGGMAGLLAARVLADGFSRVTVVEQDSLPTKPATRPGLPQDSHVHVLQEAGRKILTDLFPGYDEEFGSNGGLEIDAATELQFHDHGQFLADSAEPLPMYCASRPLFEWVVRHRLSALDGVSISDECRFQTYLTDEDATTVEGVVFETDAGEQTELPADLVVDATGRTSRTPTWLTNHGYADPPTEAVEVDLAYGTVIIERPPEDRRAVLVSPTPPQKRGGTAVPIENNRWLVTLFGFHGDHPPGDVDGFREFAATLPIPDIAELLATQPWITESVDRYPFQASLRRHYEDLDRFPDGVIVTGDAIASFNPIYGQGMSVAALDALNLHHALAGGRHNLAERFFESAAESVDVVWAMTVGSDLNYPQTDGDRPVSTRLFNWYLSRLIRAAHSDRQLACDFSRVLRLEQSPTTLLRPTVLRRVLFSSS